jgi:hypothetical protein
VALLTATYAVLAFRLFQSINYYSVNIFTWDQWDFNDPLLFHPQSLWKSFLHQHEPHRQGVGALVGRVVGNLSHWNTRSEAFSIGVIVLIASLCALWLKTRQYGPIGYGDVLIPLIFFTPVQVETYLGTTNPAHGSLPLLLIMLYGLSWTIRDDIFKYGLVLIINFAATYTGFGLFLGLVTPVLLALDAYSKTRRTPRRDGLPAIAAFCLSIISIASFFVGYVPGAAVDCFSFPDAKPWRYLTFVNLMLGHFYWNRGYRSSLVVGSLVLTISVVVLSARIGRLLKWRKTLQSEDMIIMAFSSYSLLFAAGTAIGRLCTGLDAATSSRYMIYLITGFLALFFQALSQPRNVKLVCVAVLLLLSILAAFPKGFAVEWQSAHHEQAWKDCYLQREDIQQCDELTNATIYPWPESTGFKAKLDYLKQHQLNLFAK